MDLRQLEYFVQIATHGGFNRASASAHIAQSALSRRMRQLEHELGVELFERSARGVHLTAAGELMVERASVILQQLRETKRELQAMVDTPRGEVSIGIAGILRDVLAEPLIEGFNELYPDVKITFVSGLSPELRDQVIAGRVDLAVCGMLEPERTLRTEPLMRDDMLVVGPPGSPLTAPAETTLAPLSGVPLVVSSRESLRHVLRSIGCDAEFDASRVLEIVDSPLQISMVRSGKYHSILPRVAVEAELEAGTLSAARLKGVHYHWSVVYSGDRTLSAAARTIMRMLMDTAKVRLRAGRTTRTA